MLASIKTVLLFCVLIFCQTNIGQGKLTQNEIDALEELVKLKDYGEVKRVLNNVVTEKADLDIEEAIQDGINMEKEFKQKQRKFKEIGVDGKKKKSRRIRLSKIDDNFTERQDEGVTLLSTKEALVKLTGKPIREIANDPKYNETWNILIQKDLTKNQVKRNSLGGSRYLREVDSSVCTQETTDCSDLPNVDVYRTFDGKCNNKLHPTWGSAYTTQPRFLDEVYADSISSSRVSASDGSTLPSARDISNIIFKSTKSETPDEGFNTIFSFNWGQFLDHDVVLTPTYGGEGGSGIECCPAEDLQRIECMPIIMTPDEDLNINCMEFVRSVPATDCGLTGKQVTNDLTSFIDGSNVYGSTEEESLELRDIDGLMKVTSSDDGRGLLPADSADDAICVLTGDDQDDYCQKAGDVRVNVQPGLSLVHLLFVREHNRIVGVLSDLQPSWDSDKLYNEARKIVSAMIQHITTKEYFVNLFNSEVMTKYNLFPLKSGHGDYYDPDLDPSIRVAFATAAYRFGHSQIPPVVGRLADDFQSTSDVSNMELNLLNPHMVVDRAGSKIQDLVRYMATLRAKKSDSEVEGAVRNTLFNGPLDLVSLNIQRGRDHGLPSYTEWLKFCGDEAPGDNDHNDWSKLTNLPRSVQKEFSNLYKSVHDVDLYAGGMAEKRLSSSYVGATFACILGKQFQNLKEGDRFWYERPQPEGFSEDQLDQIRKVTLSGLLCANFDIDKVKPNSFKQAGKRKSCTQIKQMDFSPWK